MKKTNDKSKKILKMDSELLAIEKSRDLQLITEAEFQILKKEIVDRHTKIIEG